MATENQKQEEEPENMRRLQLDVAVRCIQWSYAIYWSFSSTKPGVLEWGDGYYNGEIKTRKSVQALESPADKPGLQRSEQLRKLYESLHRDETKEQVAKRLSAALSPEDLTDTEWYYLVCMSFVFDIGQGLPGKTLATNDTIWLCNAHRADTKVFSRSILAKSASIKTIVCFPHLGGVVELGVTDLVAEDQNLIQQVKAYLSETGLDDCSDNFGATQQRDESGVFEGIEGEVSKLQSWQFTGDKIDSRVKTSMSDSISQNCGSTKNIRLVSKETREWNQQKDDEIHYQSVLSTLLKGSYRFTLGTYLKGSKRESSFVRWAKDGVLKAKTVQTQTPQELLKKVLLEVARMHVNRQLGSSKNMEIREILPTPEVDETDRNHMLSERKRREKLNERYSILGSLIPSGGKVDKLSILDRTIEYLIALERRLKDLEPNERVTELESSTISKPHDDIERTSDNYGTKKINNIKKPLTNKRKARDMDGSRVGNSPRPSRNSSTGDITVDVDDKGVLIKIKSSWRETMLIEIMEVINKLQMDSLSVESFNTVGILSLNIKAQFKGSKVASEGVIRQAIHKVLRKI